MITPSSADFTALRPDRTMAEAFLRALDPHAIKFTFQLISDDKKRPYAEVVHGTLDEVWTRVLELNTANRRTGIFVVVNETDGIGRKTENITRVRAIFVDADSTEQVRRCDEAFNNSGTSPDAVVRTSPGKAHYYFFAEDISREQFGPLQEALITKLGTDPAVKDLPRVMRLPGTVHWKDASRPHLVTAEQLRSRGPRWRATDLVEKLALQVSCETNRTTRDLFTPITAEGRARLIKLFGKDYLSSNDELLAGLDTNIEEIRSAAAAVPPSAITAEADWMKFARALAHEARIYKAQAEELYGILNQVSARAPNYDAIENRRRWERYIDEADKMPNSITIATLYGMAKHYGWQGWSPPPVTSQGNAPAALVSSQSLTTGLDVSFSKVTHRRFIYGVDLYRGEITVLAAPGGTGKSSLALGMAVELAANRSVLGEKLWVHQPKVLYINGEDSKEENTRRVWSFCLKHGFAQQNIQNMSLLGSDDWRAQKLSFLRTERGSSALDDIGLGFLEALLDAVQPDLVVLDPLLSFCGGGNVNDNAVMALVMRALKRLANKFDCAVLILHHTRKGGELGSAEAVSGASSIVNLARRAIMVVPMSKEEATKFGVLPTEHRRYFKVISAKSNLAPPSDDCPWYKLESVSLPNAAPPTYPTGDNVQAVVRVQLSSLNRPCDPDDQKIKKAILDLVDRGKPIDGQHSPYSPNISGAHNERALMEDALAAAQAVTAPRNWHEADLRAAVTRAVSELKSDGALAVEEIKGGRFRRGAALRVDWNKTPYRPAQIDSADVQDESNEAVDEMLA